MPLWALSAALGLGIFIGFTIPYPLQDLFILTTVCATGLTLCWLLPRKIHPYSFLVMAILSFLSYGGLLGALEVPKNNSSHLSHFVNPESRLLLSLQERRRPTAFSRPWIAKVRAINGQPASGRVLLQFPATTLDSLWLPGDKILVRGIPKSFTPPKNPGGFDYGYYMRTLGIWHQVKVDEGNYKHCPAKPDPLYKLSQWRRDLHHRLMNSGLSAETGGIFSTLLLGQRTSIDSELRKAYQQSGTAHLLAISGLHVGLVLVLVRVFLKTLSRRFTFKGKRLLVFISALLALWGYTALAGFGASVVRASIMLSLWLLAEHHFQKRQSLHFLGLSAMIMLVVINPHWVLQPGFQLSFGAVWGILAFFPTINNWIGYNLDRLTAWGMPKGVLRFIKKVGGLAAVSVSAQLGVLPVALFHFHQFPWHFLVGSLLLVPFLSVLLALGFTLLLSSFFGPVPMGLVWLAERSIVWQNSLVEGLASQQAFVSTSIRWDIGQLLLAYTLLLGLALAIRNSKQFFPVLSRRGNQSLWVAALAGIALLLYDLRQEIIQSQVRELWIPHKTAASGLWLHQGNTLMTYEENAGDWTLPAQQYADSYGLKVNAVQNIGRVYRIGENRLLRVDGKEETAGQVGRWNYQEHPTDLPLILLLSHSPKNIDSVWLSKLDPVMVIADGSNYYSALDRWEGLCKKLKIPFHATARKGAFRIDLKTSVSNEPVND